MKLERRPCRKQKELVKRVAKRFESLKSRNNLRRDSKLERRPCRNFEVSGVKVCRKPNLIRPKTKEASKQFSPRNRGV